MGWTVGWYTLVSGILIILCLQGSHAEKDCSDPRSVLDEIMNCQTVLGSEDESDTDVCAQLQDIINCTMNTASGCEPPVLISFHVAPRIYAWAMTGSALNCTNLEVDGQSLTFTDPDKCSFDKTYDCYSEIYERMGITREANSSTSVPVNIQDLNKWLNAAESLMLDADRPTYCDDYFKPPLDYSTMAECGKSLKETCEEGLPLAKETPNESYPIDLPADPYDTLLPTERLVLDLCTDACKELSAKDNATEACYGDNFNETINGVMENATTASCQELENVIVCMKDAIKNCTYLVGKYSRWLEGKENSTEAMQKCNVTSDLGPMPPTVEPEPESTTDGGTQLMSMGFIGILAIAFLKGLVA